MDLSKFGVEGKIKEVKDKKLELDFSTFKDDFKLEELERFLPWFLKYQLKSMDDLIVTKELREIMMYLENFKSGEKAILLYGAPGSGKTTTVTLLAGHYDYELFEMNASDTRNKASIQESVGEVIKQQSLFGKKKLILIDEVDGVSGTDDRGGVAELVNIVKDSPYPIIFTANDGESEKIKSLKKVADFINFENHSRELLSILSRRIFTKEKITFDQNRLKKFIDERDTTDIRGFINDLQSSTVNSVFEPDVNMEIRDYKKKIDRLLDSIYFSEPESSYKDSWNTDIPLEDLVLYLEENTPLMVNKKELAEVFSELSKADLYRGRILTWQYWRYLAYVSFYLTYGVSSAKGDSVKKIKYKKNERILKKWIYGNKYQSLRGRTKNEKENEESKTFLENLAKGYARSATRTRREDLYYFAFTYKHNKEFKKAMDDKYKIETKTSEIIGELR